MTLPPVPVPLVLREGALLAPPAMPGIVRRALPKVPLPKLPKGVAAGLSGVDEPKVEVEVVVAVEEVLLDKDEKDDVPVVFESGSHGRKLL